MKKLLTGVTAACVFGLGMMGCDLNPLSNDDKVSIEWTSFNSIAAGSAQHVTATVDGNVAISDINVKIYDIDDEDLTGDMFIVNRQNFDFNTEKKIKVGNNEDMTITVTPDAEACNGTYILKMTATAGSATTTKIDTFDVTGGIECGTINEDPLTEETVTVGNQEAGPGSALDVDAMDVYSSTECNSSTSVQAKIDAWFGIVGGNATMLAPSAATGFAPITQNWTTKNPTKFLKVADDFDDITYQSEIDALWSGSGSSSVNIAAGDVFVIKTVDGDYRLLEIVTASASTSGTASVTGKIK